MTVKVKERHVSLSFVSGLEATEVLSRLAVAEAEETEDDVAQLTQWEGVLAFEGHPTSDKRFLMPGEITERELPLPIMAQIELAIGHDGAQLAARIDAVERMSPAKALQRGLLTEELRADLADDVIVVAGSGVFDSGEYGTEIARLVQEEFLLGISIDFAATEVILLDPETYEPVDEEDLDFEDLFFGDFLQGMKGEILGATLVPHPAFEGARVGVLTAGGMWRISQPAALTASAAGMAPLKPPKAWFSAPETDLPCPLTVTDDGRVYGHLATWGECHAGFTGVCKMAPRSPSAYKYFHLGEVVTDEGDRVAVGRITVGENGHAPLDYNADEAVRHYDDTGMVTAFVTARDGKRGIWLSGAVKSDAPAEKVRDMMANPPSGDWRSVNGSLELQGVLSVPIPGFPVPRSEARLVASASEEEIVALVATGYGDSPLGPRAITRRRGVLQARLEAMGVGRRKKRKKGYASREEQRKAAIEALES